MDTVRERPESISLSDMGDLVSAWFLLLFVDVGLRLFSFQRVQRMLRSNRLAMPSDDSEKTSQIIQRQRWVVNLASHYHLIKMTCLRRALTLQKMLDGRGIQSELRFGVRKETDKLEAHAWLEREGVVINEPETVTERFAALLEKNLGGDS